LSKINIQRLKNGVHIFTGQVEPKWNKMVTVLKIEDRIIQFKYSFEYRSVDKTPLDCYTSWSCKRLIEDIIKLSQDREKALENLITDKSLSIKFLDENVNIMSEDDMITKSQMTGEIIEEYHQAVQKLLELVS